MSTKASDVQFEGAEDDLERGLALGRAIGRPYVEIGCLTGPGDVATLTERLGVGERHLRDAIAVAERVGWTAHPLAGVAYMGLAATMIERGIFAEGEEWLDRAKPIMDRARASASDGLRHVQGMLAMSRGRYEDALAAFRDGERLVEVLARRTCWRPSSDPGSCAPGSRWARPTPCGGPVRSAELGRVVQPRARLSLSSVTRTGP